jgi:hypothetical protein
MPQATAAGAMRPEAWTLDEAQRAFEEDPRRARAIAAGLDREAFNRRAASDAWSVGECLDHLCVVGGHVLPRFAAALDDVRSGGHTAAPGAEMTRRSWFDRLIVRGMGPKSEREVRFRVRAPERFLPSRDLDPDDVLERFDAVTREFVRQLDRARGHDLGRRQVPSLLFPLVRVHLGAWYTAHAAHHERHLLQAERARAAIP